MSTVISTSDATMRDRISANLRRLLAKRGMTVKDLVDQSGEPHNTVYRIVRGENVPGVSTLAALAKALDTTVDFIISDFSSE